MQLVKNLSKHLDFAIEEQDDAMVRRQKRILAGMLSLAMLFTPLIIMMIALSGQGWVALLAVAVATVPQGISYLVFRVTHNLRVSKLLFLLVSFTTTFIPVLAAGGPSNVGYSSYVISVPMIWLFLTFDFVQTIILAAFSITVTVVVAAVQEPVYHLVVDQWHFSTALSLTWVKWLWVFHTTIINVGYLLSTFILVYYLNGQVKLHEETERRLVELSEKLIELDIDDISHPGENASKLEKRVYEIVEHIRLWKPYIPQTLFMKDASVPLLRNPTSFQFLDGARKTDNNSCTEVDDDDSNNSFHIAPSKEVGVESSDVENLSPSSFQISSGGAVGSQRSVEYKLNSGRRENSMQWKSITFVAFYRRNTDVFDKTQVEQSLSKAVDVIHNLTSVQNGAIHQSLGDLITCVWSGANHQIRACRAVLQIVKQLRQEKVTVVAGMTSGNMLVGTLGRVIRLPVFYGKTQEVGYRLLFLCDILQGEVIVDSNIFIQVQHEFTIIPVDLISTDSTLIGVSTIYELCGEKVRSTQSDEWMYEIAQSSHEGMNQDSSCHHYQTAFNTFVSGQFTQAKENFQMLLQAMDTKEMRLTSPVEPSVTMDCFPSSKDELFSISCFSSTPLSPYQHIPVVCSADFCGPQELQFAASATPH